jgi:hypothetical protein
MKSQVVVQHRGSRAYISHEKDQQRWTHHAVRARLFATPFHALYFCVDREIENADILFRSPGGQEERFLRC